MKEISNKFSTLPKNVSPLALVEEGVIIDPEAIVQEFTVIRKPAIIGKAKIGRCCTIGAEPFFYKRTDVGILYRPQLHNLGVLIEDGVEIGNNVNIEYGTQKPTTIHKGTKIDHNVLIGEDYEIGEESLIGGGSILCGFGKLGNHCFIGVGCKTKPLIKIGNNVLLGIGSVATKDIPDNEIWKGLPATYYTRNTAH